MSTRRARIKAVAALPPRRKNQEAVDSKEKIKEGFEESVKNPRTPRSQTSKVKDKSPSKKTQTPSGSKTPVPVSPDKLEKSISTPKSEKAESPKVIDKSVSASRSQKVDDSPKYVIKSIFSVRPEKVLDIPKVIDNSISTPRLDKVVHNAEVIEKSISAPRSEKSVDNLEATEKSISALRPEKVPVITPTPSVKNVSASPQVISSPDIITDPPLLLPSPKSVLDGVATPLELATPKSNVQDKSETTVANKNDDKFITPNRDKKNDIPDDYSVPSVPESITEDTVMDGIVPLQTAKNAPNPIDLFKKELISEYSEVLFDPIVPLPSPSKVRPKLRPAPRLAPHRRNSIQGSASESEDESRRALLSSGATTPAPPRQRHDSHTSHSTIPAAPNREVNRIRNDSVSSSVSQVATQPPPASSPVKEKHFANKARRQEMGRRAWCRRKEVKRDALTMYDLIFYNPTTNPIVPDQDEVNAKEANAKEEAERNAKTQESEDDADDPPLADAAPVPQIKLGPNGEIVLDQESLVIKQSDANRKVSSVVREGSWAGAGGGRYTRAARTAEWSAAETVRFYRALAAVGTDFTLMAPLFPDRKRRDLYLKFKKEERTNGAQVDKALRSGMSWDPASLEIDFKLERAEAKRRADAERNRLARQRDEERARLKHARELRGRTSKGAKALETVMSRGANLHELTADEFIRQAMKPRKDKKPKSKKGDPEFILPGPAPKFAKTKITTPSPTQNFATLTLIGGSAATQQNKPPTDFATISRIDPTSAQPKHLNEVAGVPSNIEIGSLVVLRVNDTASPSKTMLQTYIAHESGKLEPVSLPPTFLSSVVGYMKKGTPSTMSTASSPLVTSPGSAASQDSRSCTPGVIQLNPSPAKRARHSSFSITPL